MNNQSNKYLPSHECMFCRKSIEEIGGRRIIAKQILLIGLSDRFLGGGNPDYPDVSVKFDENLYIHFRGPKGKWTDELKDYVINEFNDHRHPWFCQICVGRECLECGAPAQYLHGCDIIYDNRCSTHSAILNVHPGCINPDCKKHRK